MHMEIVDIGALPLQEDPASQLTPEQRRLLEEALNKGGKGAASGATTPKKGLSTGVKVGIGVSVGLVVLALLR
jgi:hypothetical protein